MRFSKKIAVIFRKTKNIIKDIKGESRKPIRVGTKLKQQINGNNRGSSQSR